MGKIESWVDAIDSTIASTPQRKIILRPHGHKRGVGTIEEARRNKRQKKPKKSTLPYLIREREIKYIEKYDLPEERPMDVNNPQDVTIELPPPEDRVLSSRPSTTRTPIDESKAQPIGRHERIRLAHNTFARRKAIRGSDKPIRTLPDWAKNS